jgi:predicted transposase/invertase (TIGR01784 family)
MAYEALNRAYARDEVREMIEARRKAEHVEATRLKQAHEHGKLEGKLEGMRQSAQRLLAHGMQREEIARVLGLDLDSVPG